MGERTHEERRKRCTAVKCLFVLQKLCVGEDTGSALGEKKRGGEGWRGKWN